eukprot:7162424-Alexandrium_andersonii.AAC.1
MADCGLRIADCSADGPWAIMDCTSGALQCTDPRLRISSLQVVAQIASSRGGLRPLDHPE